jgi:hypothetical protein
MFKEYKGIVNERVFMFNQPQMAQVLLGPLDTVVDGNAFSLTVNDRTVTFEFDTTGTVTTGRTRITIGATAADTAALVQTAVEAQFKDLIRFALEDPYLFLISNNRATDFTGLSISGVGLTNLMPQRSSRPMGGAFLVRPIKAIDVTRGVISIYTAIDNILFAHPLIRVSTVNMGLVLWNGTITIDGELVQLLQGSTPYAANNVVQLIVVGDKSEDT